ncbi:MAG TPA: TRAP transporter large permease subunit [Casimicrobiaceae bacterium]|nr:TRAP transporter large permease subunit [Casimicrobiaceae bacterium]
MRLHNAFLVGIEYFAGVILAIDVVVVFLSVIMRYFLHEPFDWAEEVAGILMVMLIFLGAATVVGRQKHIGIDAFLALFPARWRESLLQCGLWIEVGVSLLLLVSTVDLWIDTRGQTTPIGFPQWMVLTPVIVGSLAMLGFAVFNALARSGTVFWGTLVGVIAIGVAIAGWNILLPDHAIPPILLLIVGFIGSVLLGVPIAFGIAFAAALYFLANPTLPTLIYSQQLVAGANHFVLLAIPFFVLAGVAMESNGMSSRLIELLVRMLGRLRGGLNLIIIVAVAFFSGVSGSKLADIAAVGGIIMPAVRRTKQDPNEAAGLLACSGVMAETIPPCVNMIIFGFVASISIGGLFMAGVIPALILAAALAAVAIYFGKKVDPSTAFEERRPMLRLLGGALVAFIMIAMIGKGVTSGVATSTEVSAFAVVYAFVVGGLAFRELTWPVIVRLFVQSASMTGSILFIVAAASGLGYALTIERIPNLMSDTMTQFGAQYGATAFVILATIVMIVFGMILEGAPAMILFGPLLTPIAVKLGVNPLQFGTVMVIAMGLGLFAPPVGLGLFATCAITGTEAKNVAKPMLKYLIVLAPGLLALIFVPEFSLWLPRKLGIA